MIFIQILSLAFVIIFNKIMFGKFFSFLNLIQLLWHTIAIISLYGFYNTFIPSIKTYVYILIFLYSIELGYLIFYKKSESIKKKNEKPRRFSSRRGLSVASVNSEESS